MTEPDTLVARLRAHAAARGDKVFTRHLSSDGSVRELSFAEFATRAGDFAASYRAAGVAADDIVLVFLPTSPEALPAFMGAMMIGAIPSFMPCPSRKQHQDTYWESHRALLDQTGARLILTDAAHAGQMAENGLGGSDRPILPVEEVKPADAPPPIALDPDGIAFLQHSSGTTALKKGVMLTHAQVLAQIAAYARALATTADEAIVSWLPIYHDMGLIACSILPLVLGQTVTILDPFQWAARPASLLEALDRHNGRLCWLPNFAFEHLVRSASRDCRADLSRVRAFINCSEPCMPETFDRFVERFGSQGVRRDQLQVCYAMAETVFAISQTTAGEAARAIEVDSRRLKSDGVATPATQSALTTRLLSAGPALPELDITIRDGDGAVLPEGRAGEIVIDGAFLFAGYHRDSEATAARLTDGRYRTRDRGLMLDGELYVLGRTDDLIIVNGRNLHAHEVEALAGAVPGLKPGRTVAFGVRSQRTASEELVIVAERDPAVAINDAEIVRSLGGNVFEQTGIDAAEIKVVAPGWLAKTTSGKISRDRNRRKWRQRKEKQARWAPAAPSSEVDMEALGKVRRIVARLFDILPGKVTASTTAADVRGWDSLAHATVVLEVENAFAVRFPDDEMFAFADVGALAARAAALRGSGVAESRVLFESATTSIVAYGEPSDKPDLVIFAGAAEQFGNHSLMDFASTLARTRAARARRLFVTDKARGYYAAAEREVAPAINRLSPGEKIVIGNSMGGYGALRTAASLDHVRAVLAFVPVYAFNVRRIRENPYEAEAAWQVSPSPQVPYAILYGEVQDADNKSWAARTFADPKLHSHHVVPNIGHGVVGYLDRKGLLAPILDCALDPDKIHAGVADIVSRVTPSVDELRESVLALNQRRRESELPYLRQREREEAAAAAQPRLPNSASKAARSSAASSRA